MKKNQEPLTVNSPDWIRKDIRQTRKRIKILKRKAGENPWPKESSLPYLAKMHRVAQLESAIENNLENLKLQRNKRNNKL